MLHPSQDHITTIAPRTRRCAHYGCPWSAGPRGLCATHDRDATPEQIARHEAEVDAAQPRRTAFGRRRR